MRRFLIASLVLVLLALDWAALHDIVKGKEPGYGLEWGMLALSGAIFAALGLRAHRRRRARHRS